jgi:CHAD domain-containing protein
MAFRIKRKERVGKAVRRIVREQVKLAIRVARDQQQPQGERVHEVRTRLKRSRAALALVRHEAGKRADKDDQRLRDAARRLARPRDMAVQAHTFRVLGTRLTSTLPPELIQRLAAAERRLKRAVGPDEVEHELRAAARELRGLRKKLGDWSVEGGRRAVAKGVTEMYRRARRALRAAHDRPTQKRFHDWRKRVKALSYELRLIARAVPELTTTLVPKVERLAETLGLVHDLDCARETAQRHPRWFGRNSEWQRVLALIEERRIQLEGEALALADTVFSGRAKDLRSLVEIGWEVWRKRPKPGPDGADDGGSDGQAPPLPHARVA